MQETIIKDLEKIIALDEIEDSIIFSIKKEEEEELVKYLDLRNLNVEELRVVRNMLVMTISKYINTFIDTDFKKYRKYSKLIAISTNLIDREIFSKGGAV